MSLQKAILKFILWSSLLLSCVSNNKVHNYLEDRDLGTAYHSIIILTEKGCPSCNSNLANTISSFDFDSTLIIVNALGTIIDLTYINQNKLKNPIVFDFQEEYERLGLKGSGVILLNENLEVDSVFKIDARELVQQLEFVKSLSVK